MVTREAIVVVECVRVRVVEVNSTIVLGTFPTVVGIVAITLTVNAIVDVTVCTVASICVHTVVKVTLGAC